MTALVPFLAASIATLESAKLQLKMINPLITQVATEVNDISELVKPPFEKVGEAVSEARETVDSLYGPSKLQEENNALNNKINDVVETKIIENMKRNVENAKTPEELKNILINGKENLKILTDDELKNYQGVNQLGGKKIVSRTNKSISQFLNSKVTFKSILKKMTSNKRVKGVKRTRRRL